MEISQRDKLKDPKYKGEDYECDMRMAEGPFKKRQCSDMLCCLVFLLFLGGLGACSFYGYSNGDPKALLAPLDGTGNLCGVDTGYEDYPYLYFADIT